MRLLNCIILDDEKGPRERLVVLLSKFEEVKIIGIEENPGIAITKIIKRNPDIVFIDVEMPCYTGFDVVKEVRQSLPDQDFIFVTGYSQYAIKAIKNGAFDYLLKPVDIDELKEAISRYQKRLLSRPENTSNQDPEALNRFTKRELDVLKLIGEYKTAHQIAQDLNLSKHTIDTHRKNILEKSGLHKTSELVVFAREKRLI